MGVSFIEWFSEEAKRAYGEMIPSYDKYERIVIKQPVGAAAAITLWDFPISMITRKVAPTAGSGMTGCVMTEGRHTVLGPGY